MGVPIIIPTSSPIEDIPAWAIAVPIVVGVVIINVIVIALYFVSLLTLLCHMISIFILVGFLQTKEGR